MVEDGVAGLLAPFVAEPETGGIFCDFDGTLAPIIDDPERSRPLPDAVEVLGRLARRFARVGVVSGRPLAFLEAHLGGQGLILAGSYGLETRRDGRLVGDPDAEQWRPVVEEVVDRAMVRAAPRSGEEDREAPDELWIEAKGLSVAVHFRRAPGLADKAREWAENEAARSGLVLHAGRMSYELLPPVPLSKGSALAEVADGLSAVCFLGDDIGDLPAFDALDRMQQSGSHVMRVAVHSEEAPSELLARADVIVDGPEAVVDLLARLDPP